MSSTGFHDSGAASKIAKHLDKIDHDTLVEPFHGKGRVFRAMKPVENEYINDISCKHMAKSKEIACKTKNTKQCERLENAHKTCGDDYRKVLKGKDKEGTLVYMDPPFANTNMKDTRYKVDREISALELRQVADRFKKADIAVSNANNPEFKEAFCSDGKYTCHKIPRNFFSHKYYELLAIKRD